MKLEGIPNAILNAVSSFEVERGIKTVKVEKIFQQDGVAFFGGLKSDGTSTLFVAIRFAGIRNPTKDYSWKWFCPDEMQVGGLGNFPEIYDKINRQNFKIRGSNQ